MPIGANQIEDLEDQLRIVSRAAAEAIERAALLETELQQTKNRLSVQSGSSFASTSSTSSSTSSRLGVLEGALQTIFDNRRELRKPYNYQYF